MCSFMLTPTVQHTVDPGVGNTCMHLHAADNINFFFLGGADKVLAGNDNVENPNKNSI